jgi:hypothetical protein
VAAMAVLDQATVRFAPAIESSNLEEEEEAKKRRS